RAEGGALYVDDELAYGDPITSGLEIPVGTTAMLVLGARRNGDLYSSQDRDLLAMVASQLAVALANARAYGTIAELSRTLETRNVEISGLRERLEDENRLLRQRAEAATEGAQLVGDSQAIREL